MLSKACACCGTTWQDLRAQYPFRAVIKTENPWGLPRGKDFPFARRKEGDGSPFPVVIRGMWPETFHGQEYQMREDEVTLDLPA